MDVSAGATTETFFGGGKINHEKSVFFSLSTFSRAGVCIFSLTILCLS